MSHTRYTNHGEGYLVHGTGFYGTGFRGADFHRNTTHRASVVILASLGWLHMLASSATRRGCTLFGRAYVLGHTFYAQMVYS